MNTIFKLDLIDCMIEEITRIHI